MKQFHWIGACVICLCVIAAKPAKAPSLPPGDIFFTMKDRPFALERMFPGITAAFMNATIDARSFFCPPG